jgi:hypothetical protein
MTSVPISPLRQRMIDDMRLRQYGAKTEHDYVREVAAFARFGGTPQTRSVNGSQRRPLTKPTSTLTHLTLTLWWNSRNSPGSKGGRRRSCAYC